MKINNGMINIIVVKYDNIVENIIVNNEEIAERIFLTLCKKYVKALKFCSDDLIRHKTRYGKARFNRHDFICKNSPVVYTEGMFV
jgi:hypothetical protein